MNIPAPRILIVRTSALGDILHALPALQTLRRALPHAVVAWVVESRFAPVLAGHPGIDRLFAFDSIPWRETPFALETWLEIGELRRLLMDFAADVALDLQGLVKSACLGFASGAAQRIGFSREFLRESPAAWLYTETVSIRGQLHVVEKNAAMLAALGIPAAAAPSIDLGYLLDRDRGKPGSSFWKIPADGAPRLLLHPGGSKLAKFWPEERFGELGRLAHQREGAHLMISWGPGERDLATRVANAIGRDARIAPPTGIRELALLLDQADVAVAGDTGPLHLAAAVGTPAVGLFGPTDPARNGPWGKSIEVLRSPCGDLAELPAATVMEAVSRLMPSRIGSRKSEGR